MKIIAISDTHGNLPIITEPFDLMLICGDITPSERGTYSVPFQKNWINTKFVEWIKLLPFKDNTSKVIMTWGNHDIFGERGSKQEFVDIEEATNYRLKILRHELYNHLGITIFGTPYCSLFGTWAFMVGDDTLEKKFSQIPEGVDILISHDSPTTNGLGIITQGIYKSNTTGNKILAKHLERIKPKMFFSGHFHSGNHEFTNYNDTWMANVSYVDEEYNVAFKPLSFEYDEVNKVIINGTELK